MSLVSILQHPFRLLLAIALVASMTAAPTLAMAQEEEPDQATQEIQRRNFASVEQMEAAQDMSLEQRCEADQWVVMAGESLGFIASVCGIPFDVLLAHNHQISQPDLVFQGEMVNIPADPFAEEQPLLTQAQLEYIQQTFETPVIPETGEPVADVIERRNIASADRIEEAQAMSLEQRCEADQWVILSGESLGFITSVCGIPLDVLLAHNHQISTPDLVFVGELVNIPADPFAEVQPLLTQAQIDYLRANFAVPELEEAEEPVDNEEEEEEDEEDEDDDE
jgi:hypothetical protein